MAVKDVRIEGTGMADTPLPITGVQAVSIVVRLKVVVHMFTQDGTSGRS